MDSTLTITRTITLAEAEAILALTRLLCFLAEGVAASEACDRAGLTYICMTNNPPTCERVWTPVGKKALNLGSSLSALPALSAIGGNDDDRLARSPS